MAKGRPYESDQLAPKPGDYTVCGTCGTLGKWTADVTVTALTVAEVEEMIFFHPEYYFEYCRLLTMIREKIKEN